MRPLLCAAALTFFALCPARADELAPRSAHRVDLGGMKGIAYYTAEPEGLRVVTTLASSDAEAPVRFVAVLQPNQRVTLSVPGPVDRPAASIEIVRRGDTVVLARPGAPTN